MSRFVLFFLLYHILSGSGMAQNDYPFCEAYSDEGKDTLRALNSHSNSLYAGVDNYISLNPKNVPYKNILIECPGGMVMDDEPNYIIIPSRPGFVKISAYQYDKGDTILFFEKRMAVYPVPTPYITFDGLRFARISKIERSKILSIKKFEVHLSEDFIDDSEWYRIKDITIGYAVGDFYKSRTCEGSMLSKEMLSQISKLTSGTEVAFTFTIAANSDFIKRIPPIRVIIY